MQTRFSPQPPLPPQHPQDTHMLWLNRESFRRKFLSFPHAWRKCLKLFKGSVLLYGSVSCVNTGLRHRKSNVALSHRIRPNIYITPPLPDCLSLRWNVYISKFTFLPIFPALETEKALRSIGEISKPRKLREKRETVFSGYNKTIYDEDNECDVQILFRIYVDVDTFLSFAVYAVVYPMTFIWPMYLI